MGFTLRGGGTRHPAQSGRITIQRWGRGMDESYETIRAFALQQLAAIDQRLNRAPIRLRLLLSAAELSSSQGLYDEFDRIIDSVQDDL
jgi:hypothetical protein